MGAVKSRDFVALALGALLLSGGLAACTSEKADDAAPTIQVAAAASLQAPFDELVEIFKEEHPGIEVLAPMYDGSSTLAVQIIEGSPSNVFASADLANMEKVEDVSLTDGRPELFATNEMAIAVAPGNPLGIEDLSDLENADHAVVLCEDDVPCGAVSQELISDAGLTVNPVSKEQNVKAVATKVAEGEADAGLVYVTDIIASNGALDSVTISNAAGYANSYPIAVISQDDAASQEAARAFVDLVLSAKGQEVLASHGFGPPAK